MIVAGFGFRQGTGQDSLADALAQARGDLVPTALATLADKAENLRALAEHHHMGLIPVAPDAATAQTTLTRSEASLTHKSIGSVAEATALAAAGPNARLVAPRSISTDRMATCAIAIGDD